MKSVYLTCTAALFLLPAPDVSGQTLADYRKHGNRLAACSALGARDRLACYDAAVADFAKIVKTDQTRQWPYSAFNPRPSTPPKAQAQAVGDGRCKIEDWNYGDTGIGYIKINGTTTCREGRITLRIYDGSENFIAAENAYIRGYSFTAYAEGRAPSRMHIK